MPYASVMLATAQIHLGDLPTWLAAVGTVGALGAAFWQIGAERRRRHEREAQEHEERHRAQARLIAAVLGPEEHGGIGSRASDRTGIELINGSPEPVYRLLVAIVRIQGAGYPSSIESWLEREEEEREKRQHWTKEDYGKYWPLLTVPITTASILPSGRYRVWLQGIWGRGTGSVTAPKWPSPTGQEATGFAEPRAS